VKAKITFNAVVPNNCGENSPLAAARHHFLQMCAFDFGHFVSLGTTWYHVYFQRFVSTRAQFLFFFHGCGKLVTQTRFLIIYMVFIGIPAPHRITFQGVVPSSSIELFLQI